MITKILAFTDSKGNAYGTLEAAQRGELLLLMPDDAVELVMTNKEKVIDILTTKPSSKPRARKINGATRTRKPKRHEAEQFTMPIEDNTKPAA